MNWLRLVWWVFWRGVVSGAVLGAAFGGIFGLLAFSLAPILIGAIYGGLIGLGMGVVDGLVLATTTILFFNPPEKFPRYLIWMQIVSVALNFIGVYLYSRLEFPYSSVGYLLAVMAAVPAYFLSPRFVKYALSLYQPAASHNPKIEASQYDTSRKGIS
jgi:hypothetical protein